MDCRGLSYRLSGYGIKPVTVRIGASTPKGYRRADMHDAWIRYLGPSSYISATRATCATESPNVADIADFRRDADDYRHAKSGE